MMLARQTLDISLYDDDTLYQELPAVVDTEDNVVDLTGYTFEGGVYKTNEDGDPVYDFAGGATPTSEIIELDLTEGLLAIFVDSTLTDDPDLGPDGVGVWLLRAINADDGRTIVTTVFTGSVTFVQEPKAD